MAEELKNNPGTPETPSKTPSESGASRGSNNADFPTLFGNIGLMIDSSVESVAKMINSASSLTQQVSENITLTTNSDAVKEIVDNIGSLSQNVIQGVNDTLNSEQLKKTFNELGNLASTVIESAGSVARSEQTRDLFNTISTGLNQLVQAIVTPIQSGAGDMHSKKAVEIPFCSKPPCEPSDQGASPAAGQQPSVKQEKGSEVVKTAEEGKQKENVPQESKQQNPAETKKADPSRKGTMPRHDNKND